MRDAMDFDAHLPASDQVAKLARKAAALKELQEYRLLHPGTKLRAHSLLYIPGADDRATERGVDDPQGCYLPFENLQMMAKQLYLHSTLGARCERWSSMLLPLIFLRLTAVLSNSKERLVIAPEYSLMGKTAMCNELGIETSKPPLLVHHILYKMDEPEGKYAAEGRLMKFNSSGSIQHGSTSHVEKIRPAHIFEAKNPADFHSEALTLHVVQEMAFWCWKTGHSHAKAAVNCRDQWRFFYYTAPIHDREAEFYHSEHVTMHVTMLGRILGFLVDIVENSTNPTHQYYEVRDREMVTFTPDGPVSIPGTYVRLSWPSSMHTQSMSTPPV